MKKKSDKYFISSEKIAIIAEKGLRKANVTKAEMHYLFEQGLPELYDTHTMLLAKIPKLPLSQVNRIMDEFILKNKNSPKESGNILQLRYANKILELVSGLFDWDCNSPAFAFQDDTHRSLSFCKIIGHKSIHFFIEAHDAYQVNLKFILKEDTKLKKQSYFIDLCKGVRCIESYKANKNSSIVFTGIKLDNYLVKIGDKEGEILTFDLKMKE